jgi:hypothetical protein
MFHSVLEEECTGNGCLAVIADGCEVGVYARTHYIEYYVLFLSQDFIVNLNMLFVYFCEIMCIEIKYNCI